MNVQIFVPCFVDQLYPDTAMNMVRVLERVGCKISYNPKQTCCGQPGFNAGYWDEARHVAKKFLTDFEKDGYIVGPSGSCIGFIRNYYKRLFENSPEHNQAISLSGRIFEFTEFLTNILKVTDVGATFAGKATYHDACGALRECGISAGPRQLLAQVRNLELVEMPEKETCCGFGGTFAIKYEPISIGMAETKVSSALAVGAKYLISTDVSCLMHIQGYINHHRLNLTTLHIADVLASGS